MLTKPVLGTSCCWSRLLQATTHGESPDVPRTDNSIHVFLCKPKFVPAQISGTNLNSFENRFELLWLLQICTSPFSVFPDVEAGFCKQRVKKSFHMFRDIQDYRVSVPFEIRNFKQRTVDHVVNVHYKNIIRKSRTWANSRSRFAHVFTLVNVSESQKITDTALWKNVFTSAIECAKIYENYINKLKGDKPQTKNTICSRFELDTS